MRHGKNELKRLDWPEKIPCETLIRVAMSSPAPLAVIPLQDILGLGTDARMNTPGKPDGNWRWKFDWPELAQGKWSIMQRSEF